MTNQIEIPLISNGLDFIRSGLEELERYSTTHQPRCLKYSTLHIYAGIELILKERLKEEHWSLICDRPGEVNKKSYEIGDFISVNFDNCVKRLTMVAEVVFDKKQFKRFKALQQKRNRIEHFAISESAPAITNTIVSSLSVLVDFIQKELNPDSLTTDDKQMIEEIQSRLISLNEYAVQRMKDLKPTLEDAPGILVRCPSCEKRAAKINDGLYCYFCNYNPDDLGEAAQKYISNVLGFTWHDLKDGGHEPIDDCPHCGKNTFVYDQEENFCFSCGAKIEPDDLEFCDICGHVYEINEFSAGICGNCGTCKMDCCDFDYD